MDSFALWKPVTAMPSATRPGVGSCFARARFRGLDWGGESGIRGARRSEFRDHTLKSCRGNYFQARYKSLVSGGFSHAVRQPEFLGF